MRLLFGLMLGLTLALSGAPANAQLSTDATAPAFTAQVAQGAPDGKIAYAYTSLDPDKHVANTLAALRKLKAATK
jgi:hypothetical protein